MPAGLPQVIRLFAPWKRKDALPRFHPSARPVDVARRHEYAERMRAECLHGPPLSELEVAMRYGAVEAERRLAG